ncbi:GAF domain-containing protein [Uniformispora flossi]|uniref:GAF domain-containing sensor histidine kinase n=1 Tax=Uniformispora flossi TaxID=3390723 RepID=UPI003C2D2D59
MTAEGDVPVPRMRLDELQTHIERVRGSRDRIHLLLEAVLTVGGDLELEAVLRKIVESAVSLVDARYGALGVIGEEDEIARFLTVGMDEDTIRAVGPYPSGRGILGLLIREPHPLRLHDLTAHPESFGFPPDHPPMRSFLGAPVRVGDRVFGNLYLTEKRGAVDFDEDDEALLRTLAVAAGVAIDNARLYEEARRRERWLAASAELTRSLLSGDDPAAVLRAFTTMVRRMAEADLVTVVVPVPGSEDLVVEAVDAVDDADADLVRGLVLPSGESLAGKVYASGETVVVGDLSTDPRVHAAQKNVSATMGPAFMLPLGTSDHVRGVLQVIAHTGRTGFADATVGMVCGFAGHAGLALEIAERRRDSELIAAFRERDRIAHDLHDVAIQRLFAAGMTLQGVARLVDNPDVQDVVMHTVDDLDETIRLIRSTIFTLKNRDRTRSTGLRGSILRLADEAAQNLGFAPVVRLEGPLDTAVPEDLADHALAVLREGLSNAARHARAAHVEVAVQVTATHLRLTVEDDGVGISVPPDRRSGLANLDARARELGGTFRIAPTDGGPGTVLTWTVPRTSGSTGAPSRDLGEAGATEN